MSGINDMTVKKMDNTLWALEYMKAYWDCRFSGFLNEGLYTVWQNMPKPYSTNSNMNRVFKLLKAAIIEETINSTNCSDIMKYINRSDWWVFSNFKKSNPNLETLNRVMDKAITYGYHIKGECSRKERLNNI